VTCVLPLSLSQRDPSFRHSTD